jgi:hypothetical protein
VDEARAAARADEEIEHGIEVAGDARPTLDRQAEGFVEDQEVLVLVENESLQFLPQMGIGRARRGGGRAFAMRTEMRYAHFLTRGQPLVGFAPLPIHPHLAAPARLLDHPLGEPREVAAEIAVEADAGLVLGDGAGFAGGVAGGVRAHVSRSARNRAQ